MAILLPAACANAASDDASGIILKSGNHFLITGTDILPAAQLYTVTLNLSGTGSGDFITYLGPGTVNLQASLSGSFNATKVAPQFDTTLANLHGKLPATLANGPGIQYYFLGGSVSTFSDLVSSGIFTIKISKEGKFTGAVTHESFYVLVNGKKRTPLKGSFVTTSGTATINPVLATSNSAQPDLIIMANPHVAIGCGIVSSTPQFLPVFYTFKKGQSHTYTLLVRNNGPASDTITLRASNIPPGYKETATDGKIAITEATLTGAGYPLTLASGALEPINVKLTATAAKNPSGAVEFSAQSTAAPSATDFVGVSVFGK